MMEEPSSLQLRPRSIGEILDDTFRLYRQKFGFLVVAALSILIPYQILNAYISSKLNLANYQTMFQQDLQQIKHPLTAPPAQPTLSASSPDFIWLVGLLVVFFLIVQPFLYGIILHMTARHHLEGKTTSLGDASTHSMRRVFPTILTVVLLCILYIGATIGISSIFVALFLLVKVIGIPALFAIVSIVAGIALFLLLIWVLVKLSFVPSVIIEENMMMWNALVRSWKLTKRSFWRLIGYGLLVFVLVGILQYALTIACGAFIKNAILLLIVQTIISVLITPFFYLSLANMYTDLRIRTDGLDF